jgi:hypothetical protein
VFATGGSYGGFMVAWMNGHVPPGRYAPTSATPAASTGRRCSPTTPGHWHAKELGAWYWDDMAQVHAQSPHAFAGNMHTPTLVIHGALDYRVPDAQGLAYYNTLKARGVDARLLWFPDENHWILKPRNSRSGTSEFFAGFFGGPHQQGPGRHAAGHDRPDARRLGQVRHQDDGGGQGRDQHRFPIQRRTAHEHAHAAGHRHADRDVDQVGQRPAHRGRQPRACQDQCRAQGQQGRGRAPVQGRPPGHAQPGHRQPDGGEKPLLNREQGQDGVDGLHSGWAPQATRPVGVRSTIGLSEARHAD